MRRNDRVIWTFLLLTACEPKAGAQAEAPKPVPAVPAASSEWPTYHGGYGLEGVAAVAPPDRPVRLWTFKTEGRVEATPVSAGGKVFFTTTKGALVALDLAGREVWTTRLAEDVFTAPPLYTDGVLIAGSAKGNLHAFHAASGKEKWKFALGENLQGSANRIDLPGGKKGILVLAQANGTIHCVDFEKGVELWKTEPMERCDGSAGVGGGHIVFGSCASALHVFSAEKAAKVTDIALGDDGQVAGGVAFAGSVAYAGTRGGKLHAVDVPGQRILWTNSDCKQEAFTTPAVNDTFVIFGSSDGLVYGLNRETGAKVWDFDTGRSPSSPVIAGNRVVVASSGTLFLLELESGKKVWSEKVSDEITSPAVVDGKVIVGSDDGSVSAYGRP